MSTIRVHHVPSGDVLWSKTNNVAGQGAGDIEFVGSWRSNGFFFLVASNDGVVNDLSLYFLDYNKKDYYKVNTTWTPAAGIEAYAVTYPGGPHAFVGTRTTSDGKSQMRMIHLPSGNQVSTNGLGSPDVESITHDGRYTYVVSKTNNIRTFINVNGKTFRTVRNNSISGLSDVVAITYNGKGFWLLNNTGALSYLNHVDTEAQPQGAGIGGTDFLGVMYDGKHLITMEA